MAWQENRKPSVATGNIRHPDELSTLLESVSRASGLPYPWETTVIKPNWFSPGPANYTGASTLDLVLQAVPGHKLLVESHSCGRNYGGREVTPSNGRDLLPWIREQEELFFGRTGLGEVIRRHGVEYVNATEEVWGGRAAPADEVRQLVEERLGPIGHPELYEQVPSRLFDLRDRAILLDLAKIKVPEKAHGDAFSLTVKNLFGLIVEPNRWDYHTGLPGSIVDVACVYLSLFPVIGVAEGIFELIRGNPKGEISVPWGNYDVVRDAGLVVAGWPLSDVDLAVGNAFGLDLSARALVKLSRFRGI
ncbi:MAG: DUF362 domain-containing protein [Bacillota bacterium]|nr:DUF362 domain-containing protein [Bacillota bacterium]